MSKDIKMVVNKVKEKYPYA